MAMMKKTVFLVVFLVAASLASPVYASHSVWQKAHALMRGERIHVPWDGRYHDGKRFCIETFNGTNHDIKQYRHMVPPGFYLKFCSDNNYYVNDGLKFKHMKNWRNNG